MILSYITSPKPKKALGSKLSKDMHRVSLIISESFVSETIIQGLGSYRAMAIKTRNSVETNDSP